jgi:carbon monoxide dehydrogenase subunit G
MQKIKAALIFLIILAGAIAYAEVTQEEWKRLQKGEVIIKEVPARNPDGSQRMDFQAKIFVKADRKTTWKHLRDYEKFPEFMPNTIVCKIIKKDGEVYWVHYEVKVMKIRVKYDLRVEGKELYKRIEWKLDKSKPHTIRNTYGYWLLEDAPGGAGAVISYSAFVDTGIPAPEALAKKAAKKSFPQIVKNVKKRVESGGTWKKPKGT